MHVTLAAILCLLVASAAEDLEAKAQRAEQAMAARRFEEAVALYRELWRAQPEEAGLRKNLGLALYSAGHYREASSHFEAVLKREPGDAPVSFLLGMSAVKLGNPLGALPALKKAAGAAPGNPMFLFELADALNATGRPDEAIPHFQKLTGLEPNSPDAWYGLGTACTLSARRSFAEIERTAPESGYWYALMGRSRAEQGELRSAFYLYRQALARVPELSEAHAALAEIYEQTGHADWAAVETERERSSAEVTERSGVEGLYRRSREASGMAAEAFRRVLALPPSAASHRIQAEIFRLHNRHAEAAQEWREALKLAPGNAAIELELAKSLRSNQDYEGAGLALSGLLARQPDSPEANALMGATLLGLQEAARAIPYLEKAVRRDPESRAIRADLGRAYLQTGAAEKAILSFEAVVAKDTEGDLYYLLAQAYTRAGRREAAQRALAKRQELTNVAQTRAEERERNYAIVAP